MDVIILVFIVEWRGKGKNKQASSEEKNGC